MLNLRILLPLNLLLPLLPHLVKVQLLLARSLGRRRGRTRRRISKGENLWPLPVRMGKSNLRPLPLKMVESNLQPLPMRLGASNLPLLVKLVVLLLLRKLRRLDTNLIPLARFVKETTILIYFLASWRCRECGPNLKDL